MISFNQIPTNIRIPFVALEVDASQSQQGPSVLVFNSVMIGQKTAAGTGTAGQLYQVTSVEEVITLAGRGSHLHQGAMGWFANNNSSPLWIGILADDGAGVAAQGTLTFTGPATAAGTIALYLGGERLTVGVNAADTATTIAAAVAAAINAAADLPVTAAPVAGVVTLTYRHKGVIGNVYDVRHSFYTGEALPAGVGLAIVAVGTTTAGTTTPSLTTLIANMSNFWFHNWIHSYNDATSLNALEADLETRFGPMNGKEGLASSASAGTFSALTTLGSGRNSKQSSIWAQPGVNPLTPPLRFAAACVAVATLSIQADPARPVQTLEVKGVVAPAVVDLFDDDERNLMLYDGISTTKVVGNAVQLERWITTYQNSPVGAPDEAYLDATTRFNLLYLRYDFRTQFQTKFPRHKLADDGTRFQSGQAVMTPKIAKAWAVGWFRQKEAQGLVQNGDQFKRDLVVERQAGNANQLNFLVPPTLIAQLIVVAAQLQFRKQ